MAGRAFLFHWKEGEVDQRANVLRSAGWDVEVEASDGVRGSQRVKEAPPDVVVIYLDRLPSHGRETADYLRSTKATRSTPIVFVNGQGEPLEKTRAKVPDAIFTTSHELIGVLGALVEKPAHETQGVA